MEANCAFVNEDLVDVDLVDVGSYTDSPGAPTAGDGAFKVCPPPCPVVPSEYDLGFCIPGVHDTCY